MSSLESDAAAVVPRDALATALVFGHLGEMIYHELGATHGLWCDAEAVAGELWGEKEGPLNDEIRWRFADNKIPALVERSVQLDADRVLTLANASPELITNLVHAAPQLRRLCLLNATLCDATMAKLAELRELEHLAIHKPKELTKVGLAAFTSSCRESLKELVLDSIEGFDDAWLPSIATMGSALKHFELDGCTKVTNTGLEGLATLTQLRVLKLRQCWRLTEVGLEKLLSSMASLAELNLTSSGRHCVLVLHQMQTLPPITTCTSLSASVINQHGLLALQHAKSLTELTVKDLGQTSTEVFAALSSLTNLQHLRLEWGWSGFIVDGDIDPIQGLPLKTLHLKNNGVAPHDPMSNLGHLKQLEDLYVEDLADEAAPALAKLQKLKRLNIDSSQCRFSDAGVAAIVAGCPLLTVLIVSLGHNADTSAELISGLRLLQELSLRRARFEAASGAEAISRMKQLERLDLAYSSFGASGWIENISQLTNLEVLNINGCVVYDSDFCQLASLVKLRELLASYAQLLSSQTFYDIGSIRSLQVLDISACRFELSDLRYLHRLPYLKQLDVGYISEDERSVRRFFDGKDVDLFYITQANLEL